tara:strand:- start:2493 stop:2789 length:297 start_codon:yes stop_codon:yes gene_type:complete
MTKIKFFILLASYTAIVMASTLFLAQLNNKELSLEEKAMVVLEVEKDMYDMIKKDVEEIRSLPVNNMRKCDILLQLFSENRQRIELLESQIELKVTKL